MARKEKPARATVRSGCNLTFEMTSEQKTTDRVSSFCKQCSCSDCWTLENGENSLKFCVTVLYPAT